MVPSTVTSVLIFLLVVTPGIAVELQWQLTRPRRDESTFVEISRVLLAGVVLTATSAVLLAGLRLIVPGSVIDISELLRYGHKYVASNPGLMIRSVLGIPLLALALGVAAVDLFTSTRARRIAQTTLWHAVFAQAAPMGARTFISLQLKDGTAVTGYQAGYSTDPDPAKREILLAAPLTVRREHSGKKVELDNAWQRMVVAGSEISSFAVSYVSERPYPLVASRHVRSLKWISQNVWKLSLIFGVAIILTLAVVGL
ncbi:DUF6338 family protein [Amycolatopsis thailandensis]|uniref:DUF6338 family protein n=1 Tax=Amycolatopsis thailandensis TaxID=589330 RepID=UPI00378BA205